MKRRMKKITSFNLKSNWLLIIASVYFGSVLNLSLWRYALQNIEITGAPMLVFCLGLPVFIWASLLIIFSLLVWPWVGKPLLVILLVVSSVTNYMMFQYGLYIDSDMIRNVFETNRREALDFFSLSGLIWVALTGLLPAALLIRARIIFKLALKELGFRLVMIFICLAAIGLIAALSFKEYAVFGRNNKNVTRLINPTNYVYATVRYFQRQALANREFVRLDEDVSLDPYQDDYPTVFILVLGETARAGNFSLNGYPRETNPRLAAEDVISFTDVSSCGTATAVSVPCMFSDMPRSKFNINRAVFSENFIDLLHNADYQLWWRDNDDGCKKVCDRVPTEYMVAVNNPKYCDGSYCYDEVLVDGLEEYLGKLTGHGFVVLHAMGSHGPSYYKRYPEEFKTFLPTCETSEVQNCDREAIVNTYDNTILYTDHVLAEIIDVLKKFPNYETGMLYVSDHGESLGENGIYLHGLPYAVAPEEQTKVPMILWMSEVMKKEDHIDYECLKARAGEPLSHDHLFHSLIGLMELDTKVYEPELDLFEPCRLVPLPALTSKSAD